MSRKTIELLRNRAIIGRMEVRDKQLMLQAANELERAERCIYAIDDALYRGSDNDWAREAIAEWEENND